MASHSEMSWIQKKILKLQNIMKMKLSEQQTNALNKQDGRQYGNRTRSNWVPQDILRESVNIEVVARLYE